ncbi:MAG: DUF1846 domain-containing protein [Clostridia bacterium]|nr:DUF1846 domain-containing protein [Clostridia bacterium]
MKKGFNNELYVQKQSQYILERIKKFDNKLYLEFGGKLFDDLHASRVLCGFDPNAKIKLLSNLKDNAEIIFCINANDIQRNKMRADFGITYGDEVLRVIDNLREYGIYVSSIVITQFVEQSQALAFKQKLENRGEKVYIHRLTKGYPNDVDTIVSDEGYGQNPYIETTRPLVVVTAPGPSSGKLATCLSQLYHEYKRGVKAGYAKFETFPVWNLPLKHPVNVAYEAATADLQDVNMIDYFHLEAYGEKTVNYNRDLAVFPVVRTIINKITGEELYKSPTDMGVNMVGNAIIDDQAVCKSAEQEVLRRYFKALCDVRDGKEKQATVDRIEMLMSELNLKPTDRAVVPPARERSERTGYPVVSIQTPNGKIVTGRQSELLSAPASSLLNAVKCIAGMADDLKLIAQSAIDPVIDLKTNILKSKKSNLNAEETLLALSVSASLDERAAQAMDCLKQLRGCEAHSTHIITNGEAQIFRKLGINLTCDPQYVSFELFSE